jgi:hypothetical protein
LEAIVIETEAKANYFSTIFLSMAEQYKELIEALHIGVDPDPVKSI